VIATIDPNDTLYGSQPYRLGVMDECGRINLNALMQLDSSGKVAHDMLMTLPNMTEDIANSILDWIDPDDDPRPNGAENDYYESLTPPYRCKNGPLDTLEELLLVKGVTPQLLFGNDLNRNGVLDPEEDDGSGTLDLGWAAYLTVYSRELNVDSQGNPRIYINDSDLDSLYASLSTAVGSDLANYIIAYRIYGPSSGASGASGAGGAAGVGGAAGTAGTSGSRGAGGGGATPTPGAGGTSIPGVRAASVSASGNVTAVTATSATEIDAAGTGRTLQRNNIDFRRGRPQSISSLYQLINSRVSIPGNTPQEPSVTYRSPLNDPGNLQQLLPLLLDETTTVRASEIPARVNVNTAPRTVLSALPGLTDADVQNIMDHRPSPEATDTPDPIFQTPAWLITEANFPASTLQTLERYITARSQVYRVQSVGQLDSGGPTARLEAIIDTNLGNPRILYRRDLTKLGRGFDLGTATTPAAARP
jgi:DNA uptake protein ComE-like DNA-binding protein